jgi:hypothetical protein
MSALGGSGKRPPTEAAYVQFTLVDPVPYLKFISPAGLDYLKRNRYVLEKCERDPKT